ncbi:MAG: AMP-dependent synthetase/ligase [Pirellulales bacterium]|nr:AMP-dependent synthetase/ligase [Pirellulales bacterium]
MTFSEPVTVPELLLRTLAQSADQPALGTIHEGQLSWRTWQEVGSDINRLAQLLLAHQVHPGDRVAQIAANCYEWIVVDLAILSIGAVHVPMHLSLSATQLAEQIADSGAKVVFLSAAAQTKLQGQLDPSLTVFCHDALPVTDGGLQANSTSPAAEDLATLIYTSGTTGQPRGVMLSHRNLTSNAFAVTEAVGSGADETRLCFLPLSHIYARTCDLYSWLYRGSRLVLAENRETIVRDCQLVQPDVINGVPYFYQKVAQQLRDADPGKLKTLLGSKIKRCFCGGAAVAPEVEALFQRQGLPILCGYGLTETSPVITATALENYQPGTVGRPIDEVKVRLAENGEICVRGPGVMLGYWQDARTTEETIVDGWLKTGDLGAWDAEGNLRIVGRAKEMIVLSTGKNVSPMRVEQLLTSSPFVESVCVVGESRKCLAALIVPNPDALRGFIREQRLWVWSRRRAVTHPKVRELYRAEIDRLLADASQEEQVGPFAILDRNFSQEQGELTAKLSLRREKIAANFAARIEKLYR